MNEMTKREMAEIERANASELTPVVFVHGLWLLPESWDRWRILFEDHDYVTLAPGWPDDPETVAEAREHPEVFAEKSLKTITEHYAKAIGQLALKPAIVGHSFGGVITQMLAGRGLSAASVAIDPAPFRGVLPLPPSAVKSAAPVLTHPSKRGKAVSLTYDQFRYGWTNAVDEAEARDLFERYHVPGAGEPLFQAAFANVNPWSEDVVATRSQDRGPLLLISGDQDNTVPPSLVKAAYDRESRNPGVTKMFTFPNRGHSLIIDHGWLHVAEKALAFVEEYDPARVPVPV